MAERKEEQEEGSPVNKCHGHWSKTREQGNHEVMSHEPCLYGQRESFLCPNKIMFSSQMNFSYDDRFEN